MREKPTYEILLSKQKGIKPLRAALAFGRLGYNIADNVLYAKGIDENGHERVFAIAGRRFTDISDSGVVTEDIIANIPSGALSPGDIVQQGTSLTDLVKKLLIAGFKPVLVPPSVSISIDMPAAVEAGHQQEATLSAAFDRGKILGNNIDGTWDESALQHPRAGQASKYVFQGADNGLSPVFPLGNLQVGDETLLFEASVFYHAGEQPLNSRGEPYMEALPAGSLPIAVSVTGHRMLFFGHSLTVNSSSQVRSLQSSMLNPGSNTAFDIHIPQGATSVVVAYPASIRNIQSVRYVQGLDAQIRDLFEMTIIDVEGANGYNPIPYKVFTYTPIEAFQMSATYKVIL